MDELTAFYIFVFVLLGILAIAMPFIVRHDNKRRLEWELMYHPEGKLATKYREGKTKMKPSTRIQQKHGSRLMELEIRKMELEMKKKQLELKIKTMRE